jgi:general secretion pathway protein B
MSFLLEALRKSENQKRRGEVPNIHSQPEPSGAIRSVRPLRWLLVAVPAVLILAWAAWRGWGPAPELVGPGPQGTQGASTEPAAPVTDGAEPAPVPAQRAADRRLPLSADRTPVEHYQEPPDPLIDAAPGQQAQPPPDQPEPMVAPEATEQAATTPVTPVPEQEPAPAPGEPPPAQPRQYQAPMPEPINYWQVPGSVRDQLTEIRISVMVFAERPEDRFILMNGRRWVEGDEPQPGLRLEEIRRDGAVFTFSRYRFLVSN